MWMFPLLADRCTGIPINPHPGCFGFKRKDSVHTGVDLYTIDEEPVYACEDGVVVGIEPFTGVKDNSPWWYDTDCILIEGHSGVICYGEVTTYKSVGDRVRVNDFIAKVKRVILHGRERFDIPGWRPSMLHLELYYKGTRKASNGFERDVLRDPTPYLLESALRPSQTWTYDKYVPGQYK